VFYITHFVYYSSRTSCSTSEPQCVLFERDWHLFDQWHMAHRAIFQCEYVSRSNLYRQNRLVYPWASETRIYFSLRFETVRYILQTLETRLYDFYHFLPRLDRRRSLLDFGDTVLRTLFVTAALSDLHELHGILELKHKNSDTIHSLSN